MDDLLSRYQADVMRKRMELIEALAAGFLKETGFRYDMLTLYESQEATPEGGVVTKWRLGWDPDHPRSNRFAVVQEFLEEAKAHFEKKLEAMVSEMQTVPSDRVLSQIRQKKAIEGARWTVYHTGTLLKYLKETASGQDHR